jgi:hypothetical protein
MSCTLAIGDRNPFNSTVEKIQRLIERSNSFSASKRENYIREESNAIQTDYEFVACRCSEKCWCRRYGCEGHYCLKHIPFEQFLQTFVKLWVAVPGRNRVPDAVMNGTSIEDLPRLKNAAEPLRQLRQEWSTVLAQVRSNTRCGLCDSAAPELPAISGIYGAKMWSQLYYDSVVPFDSKSEKKIRGAGYPDPVSRFQTMNENLFRDLRLFAERNGLPIREIRNLDTPWAVSFGPPGKPPGGQPLSRVLDKLFYCP